MSQKLNLPNAEIGDTFIQPFQFLGEGDIPIPQGGKTYDFSISMDPSTLGSRAELYTEFTVPNDETAEEGLVVANFDHDQTRGLPPGKYNYKLRQVFPEVGSETKRIVTIFDGFINFEY